MQEQEYGQIKLKVFQTRKEMGLTAAKEATKALKEMLDKKDEVNCIFAAAPSQNEFLDSLLSAELPWERINAFHMDEYVGLERFSEKSFSRFLRDAIFSKRPFKTINYIDGMADIDEECARYSKLLEEFPPDFVFFGIGDNGHLAFNDPPVADFNDPQKVKKVELDDSCKVQQVADGAFAKFEDVPNFAITLTIPTLVSAPNLFGVVPGERKAKATKEALTGEVSEACPASILQKYPCTLYVDSTAASLL